MAEIIFNPREITNAVLVEVDIIKRDAAEVFVEKVIRDTPVKTGKARSNWRVGVNRAPRGVIKAIAETAAITKAGKTIKAAANKNPGRNRLLIVNNAPYICRLNSGWSSQAPALFIERAIRFAEGNSKLPRKKFI